MNNFYIAFSVYLNLIFIAAKLWDQISWSWFWVMSPMIIMTAVGAAANLSQQARQKKLQGEIKSNLQHLRDLVESTRVKRGH